MKLEKYYTTLGLANDILDILQDPRKTSVEMVATVRDLCQAIHDEPLPGPPGPPHGYL